MGKNAPPPVPVLVVLAILAIGAGWWFLQRYSVPGQDQAYLPIARKFLVAALAGDSARMTAATDNPRVVTWGLATARSRPRLLRALLNGLTESTMRGDADQALVLFTSRGFGNCAGSPLAITFQGPPSTARIIALSAECEPRD